MLRYVAGNSLRKYRLGEVDLRKPVCFQTPWFYVRIERCVRRYELKDVKKEEWFESKKVLGMLEARQEMEVVGGLNEEESKKLWKNVNVKELSNRQKDMCWLTVHKCLPTREFQRRRRVVDSEVCPREGCRIVENVNHVLWECGFAKNVWRKLGYFVVGLTGVQFLTLNMFLFGLCDVKSMTKQQERVLWLLMGCVKEVLWDVRNILVFRKEVISVRDCIGMICGKLYVYGIRDKKTLGLENAEGIWKFKKWKSWL
ncbi:hypothetical protein XELAEV_18042324mg [Xenopus laevis]|uniref:Reverse transcriptase zinc-binding domain-containing protein n=1 Tax=Xenopus laevis TaxID=8355 RepID=A0A974C3X5_XENLA|nr:hypothetical protein XELAEV_18042324mg [Xenopus laevis]